MDSVSGGFNFRNKNRVESNTGRPNLTQRSLTGAGKQGGNRNVKIPGPGAKTMFLANTYLMDATVLDLSYERAFPQLWNREISDRSSSQTESEQDMPDSGFVALDLSSPRTAPRVNEPPKHQQKEADTTNTGVGLRGKTSPTSMSPRPLQRQEGIARTQLKKRTSTAGRNINAEPVIQTTVRVSEMRKIFETSDTDGKGPAPALRETARPELREEIKALKERQEQTPSFSKNERREPTDFEREKSPPYFPVRHETLAQAIRKSKPPAPTRANPKLIRTPARRSIASPGGIVKREKEKLSVPENNEKSSSSSEKEKEPTNSRRGQTLTRTAGQRFLVSPKAIVKKPTAMNKALTTVDKSYLGILPPPVSSSQYQLFRTYIEHAEKLHWRVRNKVVLDGHDEYEERTDTYPHEDGDIIDHYFVRVKPSRKDRVLKFNRDNFEHFTQWTRALSAWARNLAGRPRQTGGNYGSRKGNATLMPFRRVVDVEFPTVGGALIAKQPISIAAVATPHDLSPGLSGGAEAAGDFAVLPIVTGVALNISDSAINYFSGYEKYKWSMLRHWQAAERFLTDFNSATPQEAEAYVLFMEAAEKLLAPTKEEDAQGNALRGLAAKEVGLTPAAVTASFGGQIAVHVGASSPVVSTAVAPLSIAASGVDYYVALQESKMRGEAKRGAKGRKQVLQGTLGDPHPGHQGIVSGVSNSLVGYQDVLIKRHKRERIFAAARGSRAAGNITSSVISIGVLGAVLGGVITVASAGTLAPLIAFPAAAGALAFFVRDVYRHLDEHGERWDQRTAQFLTMYLSRAQLEELLAKAADEDVSIKIEFQEGEYDPEGEQRFAGRRTITVDVRENAFVGLHVLALQIQDVANGSKSLEDIAVWLDALWHLNLDAAKLVAIIKAASTKPPLEQLDFIQNKLSPVLGIKFRTSGNTQPLPHPGPFLGRIRRSVGR